jgi:hypothetical protein
LTVATKLSALQRSRISAVAELARAMSHKQGGISEARQIAEKATAELLRAELNHRRAAPLLRANARRQQTGDLFAQIGA